MIQAPLSIPNYKRLTITLGVVCAGLFLLSGYLYWTYGVLKIRVAFASEQTQIFEDMRTKAFQGDAATAAGCLQYVVWYYPSGTKQVPSSRLDRMVEREREHAVRDILSYLRTKTGEDLGENPEAWIEKYDKR